MSKCVRCGNLFHPDFCLIIDESDNSTECVFCHLNKNTVTIKHDEGEGEKEVTKDEASNKYIQFLKELKSNPNVDKILNGKIE